MVREETSTPLTSFHKERLRRRETYLLYIIEGVEDVKGLLTHEDTFLIFDDPRGCEG